MPATPLVQRVLDAYGGAERWRAAARVEAVVSARGLLFLAKRQRPLREARCSAAVHDPYLRLLPADWKGAAGVLDGGDVHLEDRERRVAAVRVDARRAFRELRRALTWDRVDLTYFAGYAFWNYLTFPALLLREDVAWREAGPELLEATFPPWLPTHCRVQRFHVSPATGLLARHDYTAEVVGRWARAANVVLAHGTSEGVPFASHRRVTPLGPRGRPLRRPTLVEIVVHEFRLVGPVG